MAWTDAARKASAETRKSGSPSFPQYATSKLGQNWTLAKPTASNKARYSGATFVKPLSFDAVKRSYAKDHPQAALAHFGKLGVAQLSGAPKKPAKPR